MPAALLLILALTAVPGSSTGPGTCVVPPTVGLRGTLLLMSGNKVEGKIVSLTRDVATVDRGSDDWIDVARDRLHGVVPADCLDRRAPFGALGAGSGQAVRAILLNGAALTGWVLGDEADGLVLEVAGQSRELPRSEVALVIPVVERPRPIELVERHLEAPSGRMIRAGLLHLALSGDSHLLGTLGILPWLSASAGTALPVLYARDMPVNWEAGVDIGMNFGGALHLKGGLRAWGSTSGASTGAASVTVTWSTASWDLSLHAGPKFRSLSMAVPFQQDVGAALAFTWRSTSGLDLIFENWTNYGFDQSFQALAVRVGWDQFAFDAGVAASSKGVFYPWFGVTMETSP